MMKPPYQKEARAWFDQIRDLMGSAEVPGYKPGEIKRLLGGMRRDLVDLLRLKLERDPEARRKRGISEHVPARLKGKGPTGPQRDMMFNIRGGRLPWVPTFKAGLKMFNSLVEAGWVTVADKTPMLTEAGLARLARVRSILPQSPPTPEDVAAARAFAEQATARVNGTPAMPVPSEVFQFPRGWTRGTPLVLTRQIESLGTVYPKGTPVQIDAREPKARDGWYIRPAGKKAVLYVEGDELDEAPAPKHTAAAAWAEVLGETPTPRPWERHLEVSTMPAGSPEKEWNTLLHSMHMETFIEEYGSNPGLVARVRALHEGENVTEGRTTFWGAHFADRGEQPRIEPDDSDKATVIKIGERRVTLADWIAGGHHHDYPEYWQIRQLHPGQRKFIGGLLIEKCREEGTCASDETEADPALRDVTKADLAEPPLVNLRFFEAFDYRKGGGVYGFTDGDLPLKENGWTLVNSETGKRGRVNYWRLPPVGATANKKDEFAFYVQGPDPRDFTAWADRMHRYLLARGETEAHGEDWTWTYRKTPAGTAELRWKIQGDNIALTREWPVHGEAKLLNRRELVVAPAGTVVPKPAPAAPTLEVRPKRGRFAVYRIEPGKPATEEPKSERQLEGATRAYLKARERGLSAEQAEQAASDFEESHRQKEREAAAKKVTIYMRTMTGLIDMRQGRDFSATVLDGRIEQASWGQPRSKRRFAFAAATRDPFLLVLKGDHPSFQDRGQLPEEADFNLAIAPYLAAHQKDVLVDVRPMLTETQVARAQHRAETREMLESNRRADAERKREHAALRAALGSVSEAEADRAWDRYWGVLRGKEGLTEAVAREQIVRELKPVAPTPKPRTWADDHLVIAHVGDRQGGA